MAETLTGEQVWRGLLDGSVPAVLDLRGPDDTAAAPFEPAGGAVVTCAPLWRVLDDPAGTVSQLPDGTVAVCGQGHGSEMVADLLAEHSRRVASLVGGMAAWSELLVSQPVELPGKSIPRVWQVLRPAKGCLSYVVGVPGAGAVVIDPARFPEVYIRIADAVGMRIVAVVDTHLHADHISGGSELADAAGAPYLLAEEDLGSFERPEPTPPDPYPDVIDLGGDQQVRLLRLHLPGHTPGTTAVTIPGAFLAAGDTIFRGGVGRPDLTGQAETLAAALFMSIHERLADMPPDTVLLPAHWSRPDEIGPDGTVTARLGDVLGADTLTGLDAPAFVAAVTASLRPAPASYERIRAINAGAPAGADEVEQLDVGRNQCAAAMPSR